MTIRSRIAAGVSAFLFAGLLTVGSAAYDAPGLRIGGDPYTGSYHVSGGRIYVPLRRICESMGYQVSWDAGRSAAVVKGAGETGRFPIGRDTYLSGSSVYVHIRKLADTLGGTVSWNGKHAELTLPGNTQTNYTSDELYWLARIVYAEARGESMEGKIAVANTVLSRVASPDFPNTIYGVIFDTKYAVQYEPVANGTIYNTPDADSYEAARRALSGENVVPGSLYFFNPRKAESNWIAKNRTYLKTIGNHEFYL